MIKKISNHSIQFKIINNNDFVHYFFMMMSKTMTIKHITMYQISIINKQIHNLHGRHLIQYLEFYLVNSLFLIIYTDYDNIVSIINNQMYVMWFECWILKTKKSKWIYIVFHIVESKMKKKKHKIGKETPCQIIKMYSSSPITIETP